MEYSEIYVVTTENNFGENTYIIDNEDNLIQAFHYNDLYWSEYIESLIESLGIEVYRIDEVDMFGTIEEWNAFEVEYHGYDANE